MAAGRGRPRSPASASPQTQALPVLQRPAEQLVSLEAPSQMLPVSVRDGVVFAGASTRVMENLQPHNFVGQERSDAVVLGFESVDGEKAIMDFAVGTVRLNLQLCKKISVAGGCVRAMTTLCVTLLMCCGWCAACVPALPVMRSQQTMVTFCPAPTLPCQALLCIIYSTYNAVRGLQAP